MIIKVKSKPAMVILLNFGINVLLKYSSPLFLMTDMRVNEPAARGITTNKTTDNIKVFHGTATPLTPNKNATIGVNATSIIKSFVATCTTVYAGFPLVKWLQTNTIAVHGAAPRRTAPARYCRARSSGIIDLNTTKKKKDAMANIVKGLISQLVAHVTYNPFGFLPTFFTL